MRIVISAVLYGRGGTETHLLHLSKVLINQGHQVVLACRYADRSTPLVQQHKQIGIKRLTTPFDNVRQRYKWSTIVALLTWPFYLIRKRPDIILTFDRSRFLHFLRFFLRSGGKTILLRAGLPAHSNEKMPSDLLRILDGVITESSLQSEASLKAYPSLPTQSIPLLGNIGKSVKPRQAFSEKDNNEFRIAYLGRYDSKKGIYRLLDLWPLLKGQPLLLEYFGHGAEKQNLMKQIRDRNLGNQICVNDGWSSTNELEEIMKNIDLLVLPSEEEGLPVILMEAMAYGVPFVATDVGATRTYAENNPDVRIVPLDNGAIASAIDEVISAIRLGAIDGQRLQMYYNEHYAFSKLAHRWVDVIENTTSWTG